MTRVEIQRRASNLLRDESNTIYTKNFINENINEGVDRLKQLIAEFSTLPYLLNDTDVPTLVPVQYHHLLAIYAMARCFEIDERHYEANKYMNEFEIKVDELKGLIAEGVVVIKDANGVTIVPSILQDFVVNVYYKDRNTTDEDSVQM